MTINETIGARLAHERKRLGLSQADFARLCGVKSASQFLYEKNSRSPSAEYLAKALAIGVRLGVIFDTGSNDESLPLMTLEQMVSAFIATDIACRDANGRLLDLEHRVADFKSKIVGAGNVLDLRSKQSAS